METLLGEWGKTHFLLQRSKILKKEKKKNGQGKKVALAPASAMKKQEAKKLVFV